MLVRRQSVETFGFPRDPRLPARAFGTQSLPDILVPGARRFVRDYLRTSTGPFSF